MLRYSGYIVHISSPTGTSVKNMEVIYLDGRGNVVRQMTRSRITIRLTVGFFRYATRLIMLTLTLHLLRTLGRTLS